MPRKNTLSHADFVRIEKAKFRRERGAFFVLSFGTLPSQKTQEIKAVCVVSKKTATRAVDRNLIKRRWREAMRKCLSDIQPPSTFVFYAMRGAKDATYAEMKNDVETLIARVTPKIRT